LEEFERYLMLVSKVRKILRGEIEVSEQLLDEIKGMFTQISSENVMEVAYLLSYVCLKYNVGDFWFFANLLKKTVWFNKLMGVATLFSYKRGERFDAFVKAAIKNADELSPGYRSLAYILLAESLVDIDYSLTKEMVEKAIKFVEFAFDNIISGVVSTLSRLCLKTNQNCISAVQVATSNLVMRRKIPAFEKVDILTYVSELASAKFADYSEELLDEAIDYYAKIIDPELKGLALIMIQKALLKLSKIDMARLKKYETHEYKEIRNLVNVIKKMKK